MVKLMPSDRKANARHNSFCPLAIAGVRTNTEWRKRLLKNNQQAGQVDGPGPGFLSIPILRSVGTSQEEDQFKT